MTANNHHPESQGAKSRDNKQPQTQTQVRKPLHQDWRVQLAAVLMIGLMMVYVMTQDLALTPRQAANQPMPASNGP
jgi:hypothetical protein